MQRRACIAFADIYGGLSTAAFQNDKEGVSIVIPREWNDRKNPTGERAGFHKFLLKKFCRKVAF